MPTVKTITNPKLSSVLDFSNCDIIEDSGVISAHTYLQFDLSELSESMELNLNKFTIPS